MLRSNVRRPERLDVFTCQAPLWYPDSKIAWFTSKTRPCMYKTPKRRDPKHMNNSSTQNQNKIEQETSTKHPGSPNFGTFFLLGVVVFFGVLFKHRHTPALKRARWCPYLRVSSWLGEQGKDHFTAGRVTWSGGKVAVWRGWIHGGLKKSPCLRGL